MQFLVKRLEEPTMSWENQRKKKKKKTKTKTKSQHYQRKKKVKKWRSLLKDMGAILSKYFFHFSLQFFLQFEEMVFWRGRRENLWVLPLFSPPLPLNQTPFSLIFSSIFHSFFYISLKSQSNKSEIINVLKWVGWIEDHC